MNKLKKLISSAKNGLKKDRGANLDYAALGARWDAMCQFVDGLKQGWGTNLDDAALGARWDAMCQFVDNAAEYGVKDFYVRYELLVINQLRRQEQGAVASVEHYVKRPAKNNEEKAKLTFGDEYALFEFDAQSDGQYDILTCKRYQNLQAKFSFNKANQLTEVSYRNKIERDWGKKIDKYEDEKVIDLQQKQINQDNVTEMTK